MKDLQVGDKVLTSSNKYQPVYSFGHYNPEKQAEFRQLYTADTVLELTAEHLVFLKDQAQPVRADSLQVGDSLRGQHGKGQIITKIDTVVRQGLYAPFTPEGTVVVDGIVASSYISLQEGKNFVELKSGSLPQLSQHGYVHMGLSPMRLLCMGVSSSYCTTYNEEGIPFYAALSIDLNLWANEQGAAVQALAFTGIFLLTGASLAAETVFGPSLAPLAIFILAGLLLWRKRASSLVEKQKSL